MTRQAPARPLRFRLFLPGLRPGDRSLVAVGAPVAVDVQDIDGTATMARVNAGRNGFAPPY